CRRPSRSCWNGSRPGRSPGWSPPLRATGRAVDQGHVQARGRTSALLSLCRSPAMAGSNGGLLRARPRADLAADIICPFPDRRRFPRTTVMLQRTIILLLLLLGLTACAVNPVTGKREIVLVGEETEIRMGEQNYLPMQQSQGGEYDIDPALTEYVQGVGQKLAAVSDRDLPYEFVVLNNSVPNAWALPGGKIAINRGLLTELESEAELAAVLGHEIVHAAAGHSANQV